jgi:hypothetical protein
MRLPRQLFTIIGSAAVLAAIALGGLSFAAPGIVAGGNGCPSPDPTPDPTASLQAGIIQAFGEVCETPTEDEPNRTHTPVNTPTEAPEPTEPVATTAPSTPVPPAATNTPTGGSAGGGVAPPNTGTGTGDASTLSSMWVLAAFALLGGGLASVAYGMRRK